MLIILPISDKQGEAELYSDSGNRINLISVVYYVCPCLGQQVRETVEILFVICFEPFFHFRAVGLCVKVWLFMKADRQPGTGCEC